MVTRKMNYQARWGEGDFNVFLIFGLSFERTDTIAVCLILSFYVLLQMPRYEDCSPDISSSALRGTHYPKNFSISALFVSRLIYSFEIVSSSKVDPLIIYSHSHY